MLFNLHNKCLFILKLTQRQCECTFLGIQRFSTGYLYQRAVLIFTYSTLARRYHWSGIVFSGLCQGQIDFHDVSVTTKCEILNKIWVRYRMRELESGRLQTQWKTSEKRDNRLRQGLRKIQIQRQRQSDIYLDERRRWIRNIRTSESSAIVTEYRVKL